VHNFENEVIVDREMTEKKKADNQKENRLSIGIKTLIENRKHMLAKVTSQKEMGSENIKTHGILWDCLRNNNYFQLIHFHEYELLSLGYDVEEELNGGVRRGRVCSLTPFDDLALYLLFLSTTESQERISILTKIDASVICKSLSRIRPVLQSVLRNRQPKKPDWVYDNNILFPECPYIVDGTSIKIPKPHDYKYAKKYYNKHHGIYCMNVEVVMMRENV
jgi:hypothetical protein